jgi:hypothetical protein
MEGFFFMWSSGQLSVTVFTRMRGVQSPHSLLAVLTEQAADFMFKELCYHRQAWPRSFGG